MGAAFGRWEAGLEPLDSVQRFSLLSGVQQQLRKSEIGRSEKHEMSHFLRLVDDIPIAFERDLRIESFTDEGLDHAVAQAIRIGADVPFPLPVHQGPYFFC